MHRYDIAPDIAARALASRGGRATISGPLDPARTAHLIIDMQNGFVEEGGLIEIPVAREIVPAINRISAAVRAAGGVNVFVLFRMGGDDLRTWSNFYTKVFDEKVAAQMSAAFTPGAHGYELYDALTVDPADLRVDKARFGGFTAGTSDLHALLQERGIDTLIISGTATNICCETTARGAMELNYKVILVSDATAAISDLEHNAALNSLTAIFADVLPTDAVVAMLEEAGSG